MQYEYPHFRIDRNDWLKGSNTFDNYPDGGIQYSSNGYNVFKKPGWLTNSPDLGNTVDSSLPVTIGLSWGYGKGTVAQQVVVIGSNGSQDGSFYTVSSSTGAFTKVGADETGRDYQLGKTSTVFYKGNFFTTSTTDICMNSADLVTRDPTWWITTKGRTSLDSSSPHPQVVFGDIHYIADGRYIHQNDNGTVQYNVFDLGQDWVITDMCVYLNKIYIAAEPYYNFNGAAEGFSKLFTWNGYADSWIDEWDIGPRVNALKVFKGVLYAWTPQYMSYWNGSILKNLYPMTSGFFCYSNGITTTEDSMYFADGTTLVRYGSPYPAGSNRFHRFQSTGARINGIGSYTANGIEVCTTGNSNGSNYAFLSTAAPAGNKTFIFNRRIFSQPVRIRGYVIHVDGLTSSNYVQVSYTNDSGNIETNCIKRLDNAVALMTGKQHWRFDVMGVSPTTYIDPWLNLAGAPYVRAIDVLYEPSSDKQNA